VYLYGTCTDFIVTTTLLETCSPRYAVHHCSQYQRPAPAVIYIAQTQPFTQRPYHSIELLTRDDEIVLAIDLLNGHAVPPFRGGTVWPTVANQ
jgi:hypothetical protein